MELSPAFTITLISSIVASGVQLTVFVVLYKTLKAIHVQNTNHEKYFKNQAILDKNILTFKFADWLASEVKYYSPLYENNKDRKYILSQAERDDHLIAMAKKVITLCISEVVDVDILKDELERLIATLHTLEPEPTEIIVELRKLL